MKYEERFVSITSEAAAVAFMALVGIQTKGSAILTDMRFYISIPWKFRLRAHVNTCHSQLLDIIDARKCHEQSGSGDTRYRLS